MTSPCFRYSTSNTKERDRQDRRNV